MAFVNSFVKEFIPTAVYGCIPFYPETFYEIKI